MRMAGQWVISQFPASVSQEAALVLYSCHSNDSRGPGSFVAGTPDETTKHGIESQIKLNHLSLQTCSFAFPFNKLQRMKRSTYGKKPTPQIEMHSDSTHRGISPPSDTLFYSTQDYVHAKVLHNTPWQKRGPDVITLGL